jgi:hypothetical protein
MKYKNMPAASHAALMSFYKELEEQKEKEADKYFEEITEDNGSGAIGEADLVHEGHGIFMSNLDLK